MKLPVEKMLNIGFLFIIIILQCHMLLFHADIWKRMIAWLLHEKEHNISKIILL